MCEKGVSKMKVAENREEIFTSREYKSNYVANDENRSRYNNWRNSMDTRGYVRSRSNPKFFWMRSKNTYVRDNSKFKRSMSMNFKS